MYMLNKADSEEPKVVLERKQVILSGRQQQVLDLIVVGDSYKEIAYKMQISDNTVAYHVSVIKAKLKCVNSRGIIPAALKMGLISGEAY